MRSWLLSIATVLVLGWWIGFVTSTGAAPDPLPPTPIPLPLNEVMVAWQKGPHSHTYDQGKGPNTYCSRCHSPLNWDPASKVDPQPNCVSCKFPFDKSLRVAQGNPPVAEKDWKSIGCEICHRVENGAVDPQPAWWNAATHQYETVADATTLCEKCHTDTETLRHRRDLGTSAHRGFGCTSCHNAHSGAASCSAQGCHSDVLGKSVPGHDQAHQKIDCVACHDASGLTVGPDQKSGRWSAIRTTTVMDRTSTGPYQSHNLQRLVDCSRCHYPANPWGLSALGPRQDASGQTLPPAATPATGVVPTSTPGKPAAVSLVVASPGEGETLYAGPSVLAYTAQMTGSVVAQGVDPSRVDLKMEIDSHGGTIGSQLAQPLADGSFSFDLTVNADASMEKFPPERQSCETCHRQGGLSVPPGPSTLRVIATLPSGEKAVVERHVVVDRAGYATVPARVVLDKDPSHPVAGLPVSGAAWLHLWRTRIGAASTDSEGLAQVRVEALATDPTHYRFQIEPTVLDRTIYESTQQVQVDLPAGATTAPPIALSVRTRLGEISGKIKAPAGRSLPSLTVSAVLMPEGTLFRTETSAQGAFSFSNLPVGDYVLTLDEDFLASQGVEYKQREISIPATGQATAELELGLLDGTQVRGVLRGDERDWLPFGWVVTEKSRVTGSANPLTGEFSMPVSPGSSEPAEILVPGYFSQVQLLSADASTASREYKLVRRPETRSVRWGNSEVVLPPESEATVGPQLISITRGWVWGHGGDDVLTIKVGEDAIRVLSGAFALEVLPDRSPLLYVVDGRAVFYPARNADPIEVKSGQVMVLSSDPHRKPVVAEQTVLAALRIPEQSPIHAVPEPNPGAQIRDRLAETGIGAVQAVTLATYSLVVLLLVPVPVVGVAWWWKRRSGSISPDSKGNE